MRKITQMSVNAFINGEAFEQDNTEVKIIDGDIVFNLHGNTIARITHNQNTLIISDCGWRTVTTKERLNGILKEFNKGYIKQSKKRFYYHHNNKIIDMGSIENKKDIKTIELNLNKIYVTMTDKFMSGWGNADGLINKYIIVCDNYQQADIIERNAQKRSEMKHINIRRSTPYYGDGYLSSYENFNELGEVWTR
jgi:hypothetical protein